MLLDAIIAGFGLSMDAFAVSVTKGLEQKRINVINMLVIALFFGFFQFAMPVLGFYFCRSFSGYIESFDHWIAFILLVFLGAKMIFETIKEKDSKSAIKVNGLNSKQSEEGSFCVNEENNLAYQGNTNNVICEGKSASKQNECNLKIGELFFLALATSIDALVTGITFAFSGGNIFLSAGIIGIITFVVCCIGFIIGNFFGVKFKKVAEIIGGVVLILLGIKFLLEGYNIINLGF